MNLNSIPMGLRIIKRQKPMLKGTDVRRLQQTLKHLGFFRSRVDGVFGDNTHIAVKCFQKAFDQNPTGIANDAVFSILRHLIQNNLGNWVTFQRDFSHTGYSNMRIPIELNLSAVKKIPEIISINYYRDKLIVTTASGIYTFNYNFRHKVWGNTQITPKGYSTIGDYRIISPSGNLAVIDMFSGSIIKIIDVSEFSLPTVVFEGVIYASSDTGILYAFDQSYSILWRYRTDAAIGAPAVCYDNIYFTSSSGSIYCIDNKGLLNWKIKIADIVRHPICIFDGKVFVIGDYTGIYAINPLTGNIIWKKDVDAGELLPPAFHEDFMLIVNQTDRVSAINIQRPETKWAITLEAIPSTPPIICHNTVFIGTEDGLIAYDLSKKKKKRYLGGEAIRALAQGAFDIYVATDSKLIRLSPKIYCI